MKHNLRLLTMLVMVGFFMFSASKAYTQTATPPSVGDGTEANPYQIENLDNLYWLSQNSSEWEKHYIQTADIDASASAGWDNDSGFTPIGNNEARFKGCYNGKNHSINNLFISRPERSAVGFFGYIDSVAARVDSLNIIDADITGLNSTGTISGKLTGGVIFACNSSGNVKSEDIAAGGIVGHMLESTVENCSSSADVQTTNYYAGGLVGHIEDGTIKLCYSTGTITANIQVGGLIGKMNDGTVQNCFARGDLEADSYMGGLIATAIAGTIDNCYSANNISNNTDTYVNGFVGFLTASVNVNHCFYDADISGYSETNGAVAMSTQDMTTKDIYYMSEWDFMDETLNGSNDYWGINDTDNDKYPFLKEQGYSNNPYDYCTDGPISDFDDIKIYYYGDSVTITDYRRAGYGIDGYVAYINSTNDFDYSNDEPTIDTVWRNSGQQCVYHESEISNSITIKGLNTHDKYYFEMFAYSNCSGSNSYDQKGYKKTIYVGTQPEGEGTVEVPYQIETYNDLLWISDNDTVWDKHFIQTANINAARSKEVVGGFKPIATETNPFEGTYYGNGFIIDSLYIKRSTESRLALFAQLGESALVDSLGLTQVYISGNQIIGGLVGANDGTIKSCYVTGNLYSSSKYLGGIAGLNLDGGEIKKTYSDVVLICNSHYAGGISSKNYGKIIQCFSKGSITGELATGGIIGANSDTIENCYSIIFVNASRQSGTIVGRQNDGLVTNCYSADTIRNGKAVIGVFTADAVNGCYYNSDSVPVSVGYKATGITSEEMRDTASFENWDFMFNDEDGDEQIWGKVEEYNYGYPFLKWHWNGPILLNEDLTTIEAICSVEIETYPEAIGIYGETVVATTDDPLSYNEVGEYSITWTFTDESGKSTTQEQTVIITDDIAPVPDVDELSDITDECSVIVEEIPTATDNCTGTINGTTTDPLEYSEQGTYTITWLFEDENGNSTSQEQTIVIEDVTNPTVSCIENKVKEISGNETVYVVTGDELDIEIVDDNCEIDSVSNDFNNLETLDGAEFPIGTTTVIWTVVDMAGNNNECSFDVTVTNTTGVNSLQEAGFTIYPNPVSDKLSVVSDNKLPKDINIYDLTGKIMYSNKNIEGTEKIDFSQFNSGVYIISIKTDNSIFTRKILKK